MTHINHKELTFVKTPKMLDSLAKYCSPSEFMVMFKIVAFTIGYDRESHELTPSFIAKGTGMSEMTVKRAVKELVSKGWVNKITYAGKPTRLEINLDGMAMYAQAKGLNIKDFFVEGDNPKIDELKCLFAGRTNCQGSSNLASSNLAPNKDKVTKPKKIKSEPSDPKSLASIAAHEALEMEEGKQPVATASPVEYDDFPFGNSDRKVTEAQSARFQELLREYRESKKSTANSQTAVHQRVDDDFSQDASFSHDEVLSASSEPVAPSRDNETMNESSDSSACPVEPASPQCEDGAMPAQCDRDWSQYETYQQRMQRIYDAELAAMKEKYGDDFNPYADVEPEPEDDRLYPGMWTVIDGEYREVTEEDCYG